jgi:hypothetical protein
MPLTLIWLSGCQAGNGIRVYHFDSIDIVGDDRREVRNAGAG